MAFMGLVFVGIFLVIILVALCLLILFLVLGIVMKKKGKAVANVFLVLAAVIFVLFLILAWLIFGPRKETYETPSGGEVQISSIETSKMDNAIKTEDFLDREGRDWTKVR